jgi:hypothetical protein
MVESGGKEIAEDQMLEALAFGHEQCKALARIQKDLIARAAKPRWPFDASAGHDPALEAKVKEVATPKVVQALAIHEKLARAQALDAAFEEVVQAIQADDVVRAKARGYFEKVEKTEVRRLIVDRGIRVDGRSVKEIRPIWSEVEYLPRAHGSALFTRGETQALVAVTLGTKSDEQKVETLEGESFKPFMLHYNFPSFSVREVKPIRGPGRRHEEHGPRGPVTLQEGDAADPQARLRHAGCGRRAMPLGTAVFRPGGRSLDDAQHQRREKGQRNERARFHALSMSTHRPEGLSSPFRWFRPHPCLRDQARHARVCTSSAQPDRRP